MLHFERLFRFRLHVSDKKPSWIFRHDKFNVVFKALFLDVRAIFINIECCVINV